jgi:toxin secretion/phage lysis holin
MDLSGVRLRNAIFTGGSGKVKPQVLKWIVSFGLAIAAVFAKLPYPVQVLLALMMIDYATGLLAALIFKVISSDKAWKGLAKKFLTLIVIWVCHLMEGPLNLPFHMDVFAAYAYMVYEIISILENCNKCGVPLPGALIDVLLVVPKPRRATASELERLRTGETQIIDPPLVGTEDGKIKPAISQVVDKKHP